MIDIHCHILPGVDDGAKEMKDALEMARLAYEDGIRHIIATPHFNNHFLVEAETVRAKVKELQAALDTNGIGITIYPGNEVRLESWDFVQSSAENGRFCYLAENPAYVLFEMTFTGYPQDAVKGVKWFRERGTQPIIPHPERHLFFREKPELLEDLIHAGAWTQVSVDSLVGKNGEDVRFFAYSLIDRGFCHTLATDAHNELRRPNLSEGFRIVERHAGTAAAQVIRDRMNAMIPAK
ncbi:CpsB/CapC family capsule biosynthesis tyrosine phosphatase [Paenibacillus turpanensis]|uniref:CpsB/CapC family capsule biosynthesis tyrosine phosphatase n=1 Tax=Paenibacillus turpanensis TaxID=2689078 RepID=UPI00140A8F5C